MSDHHMIGRRLAQSDLGSMHAVTPRTDDGLSVAFLPDVQDLPAPGSAVALAALPIPLLRPTQVHGVRLVEVAAVDSEAGEADGSLTGLDGLALGVVTADCLPVLLHDGAGRIAAVHAGWRGLAAGILERAVERLMGPSDARGSESSHATAWIGPAIGPCCFEVQEDVAERIARRAGASCLRPRPGSSRPFVDLVGAATLLLQRAGLEDVRRSVICTRCDQRWASYRRSGPRAGRNLAVIWRAMSNSNGSG